MKHLRWFLAVLLVVGFASVSWAVPILNDDGTDGFEDVGGAPYATWVNSGAFQFIEEGNDQNLDDVEAAIFENLTLVVELTFAGTTITGAGTDSGTWATVPAGTTIEFYSVKAGNAYALYLVDPAESTGSWSTFDLWDAGIGGNEPALQISHFTGFNPGTSVPEPGTLLLLGSGLVGLVIVGRKFRA